MKHTFPETTGTDEITVRFHKWAVNPGEPRLPGVRIGRGSKFLWIPRDQVFDVASKLADFIEEENHRNDRIK